MTDCDEKMVSVPLALLRSVLDLADEVSEDLLYEIGARSSGLGCDALPTACRRVAREMRPAHDLMGLVEDVRARGEV